MEVGPTIDQISPEEISPDVSHSTGLVGLGLAAGIPDYTRSLARTIGGGRIVLSPASVDLILPHLAQGENLQGFIERERLRPAAFAKLLGLPTRKGEARRKVYYWYGILGIDYTAWPVLKHKRTNLSQETRRSTVLTKLKKALKVEDPEREIGRLLVRNRLGLVPTETSKWLRNPTLKRRLGILETNKQRLIYAHLLSERMLEFMTEGEIAIIEGHFRDGIPMNDVAVRLDNNAMTKKPLSRQTVNNIMNGAWEKVRAHILFQAQGGTPWINR